MQDPRYKQLADVIVGHSCKVQAGEKVIVETFDIPEEFTAVLLRRIHEAGGHAAGGERASSKPGITMLLNEVTYLQA